MPWNAPADPVAGTVITVAYAVANMLDPIRWLRAMTGGADPPGSSYVLASSSTGATSWTKLIGDMIAAGTIPDAAMQDQKVNRGGDTMTSDLTLTRSAIGAPGVGQLNLGGSGAYIQQDGSYFQFVGRQIRANSGMTVDSSMAVTSAMSVAGALQAQATLGVAGTSAFANDVTVRRPNPNQSTGYVFFGAGTRQVGDDGTTLRLNGPTVVAGQLNVSGSVVATSEVQGSILRVTNPAGAVVGPLLQSTGGIIAASQIQANAVGAAPFVVSSGIMVPTLNVERLGGYTAQELIAAGGGGSISGVPSGVITYTDLTTPPSGWTFYTAANARFLVGAGPGFALGASGGAQTHAHTSNIAHGHGHNIGGDVGAATGTPFEGNVSTPGAKAAADTHDHGFTISGGVSSLANPTNVGTDAQPHLPPYLALNVIRKS